LELHTVMETEANIPSGCSHKYGLITLTSDTGKAKANSLPYAILKPYQCRLFVLDVNLE